MSIGADDVFVIVVNFMSHKWEAKHVTIELFKCPTLVVQLWHQGYNNF
jgi:hypothetical protein